MRHILFAVLIALVLGGCASTTWIAADAGPAPSRLVVRMAVPRQSLPDWVGKRRPVDSTRVGEWLQPRLATGIRMATGIDTIAWDDSLQLIDDSMDVDGERFAVQRPMAPGGVGWLLVLSPLSVGYEYSNGTTLGGLALYGSYLLLDRASGKILAKGHRYIVNRSLGEGEKEWAFAAKEYGRAIGAKLPRH